MVKRPKTGDVISMIKIRFQPEKMIPVDELVPHPKNRNAHPKDQIERLADILKSQGWRYPIKVSNQSGFITSGHGRLEAAKLLGLKEVPVSFQDYEDEALEYADLIADNAIASWSELDFSGINSDIGDLGPDFNVDLLGIKNFKIDVAEKELGDPDSIPEKAETRVKKGEVWILGDHRLMCGDSTNGDDVGLLMADHKAELCFTSPPYNLGDNAKLRGFNGDGVESAYNEKSDHKTESDYLKFLIDATKSALSASNTVFWNIQLLAGNKFILPKYWSHFSENLVDVFCWDKEHAQPAAARRVLNSVWEFIFVFSNENRPTRSMKHGKDFRGTVDNIYRLNPNGKKDVLAKNHRAVFPVEFAEFFVDNFSDSSVLDLFGGSGSTLIACEKTKRKCFMMEIDPHYCDVIIARWEKYTGKTAVLA